MNELSTSNQNVEIKFKAGQGRLAAGIFLAAVGCMFELCLVYGIIEDGFDGVIVMILGTIFFCGPIIIAGIWTIFSHYGTEKNLKALVEEYGEENLIANIRQSTLAIYPGCFPAQDVYFTDKFVIDPGTVIIDYQKISMMYKHVRKSHKTKTMYIFIAFELVDGSKHYLCGNARDEQIMKIMQLCYQHNPNILLGDTPQNREQHNYNVEKFKQGYLVIPEICFESKNVVNAETAFDANLEDVQEYISKNYIPEHRNSAIEYYRQTTGRDVLDAEYAVDDIFKKREEQGGVLETPWEWTPEGRKYAAGGTFIFIGVIFCVAMLVMCSLTMNKTFSSDDKAYKILSEEERTRLLDLGYQEYVLKDVYKWKNYRASAGESKWQIKQIYIFQSERERDGYIGIVTEKDWKYYCGDDWSGFLVLYKGELSNVSLEIENDFCDVPVIDGNDIYGVYGIQSEESLMEEQMTKWMFVGMFGLIILIGFSFILIGCVMRKKYKK